MSGPGTRTIRETHTLAPKTALMLHDDEFGHGFSITTATAGTASGAGKRVRTILRLEDRSGAKISSWDDENISGLTHVTVQTGKTTRVIEFRRRQDS